MSASVLDQSFWDGFYENLPLIYDPEKIEFRDLFARYLKPGGTCFEVGCYPGNFLIYLGQTFGYTVSGIDMTPHIRDRLPEHFSRNKVQVGHFYQGDFLSFETDETFDVVCSFGFIEHFTNFDKVIEKHVQLVKPGGTLIISCPNFRKFQFLLRFCLERENLSRHVIRAMDFRKWSKILGSNNMHIVYQNYHRTAGFWVDVIPRNRLLRLMVRIVVRCTQILDRNTYLPNPWLSPHMISFSRKNVS
jgi:2-polyprenyl-3-methyl-5-hydroxy-6-metoxy-1,4-benzoquinol methylase